MLEVENLQAWYGKSHVLQGVNLHVGEGEIVALLGRNGAGRSTTVRALMGELRATGTVRWQGRDLLGLPSHAIARLGIGCVPEQRDIFPGLSVMQNLQLGLKPGQRLAPGQLEALFALFPALAARRDVPGGALSGGEQQMLCIARTLMGAPRLLLVDEPTEGLAPRLAEQVAQSLRQIAAAGAGILLVEQRLGIALRIAARVSVMGRGRIVFKGTPAELLQAGEVRREWLEV
jgi:branched-chain amino acid transport system ATP-binding protein